MRVKMLKELEGYQPGRIYVVSRPQGKALIRDGLAEETESLADDEKITAGVAEDKKAPQTIVAVADLSALLGEEDEGEAEEQVEEQVTRQRKKKEL